MPERDDHELSAEQLRDAAGGDLNVLAIMMFVGSAGFSALNWTLGTLGWIAALATVSSTAATALGLLRRNEMIAAFTKIGFGVSGLAAPLFGVIGVLLAIFGVRWGWAVLGGAVLYFGFSLLGLEILDRAERTGALKRYEPS